MFIPTKSDGQKLGNLRKKTKRINIKKKIFSVICLSIRPFVNLGSIIVLFFVLFFVFFSSGTHMSLFIPFSVRFSPETIYFVPVSILFILIEYSLNTCHFSEFFLKSRFQVSL